MAACLFCDIVSGKIPAKEIYRDEDFLVFEDINPVAPTHLLLIPRRHIDRLTALGSGDADLMGQLVLTANKVAATAGLNDGGFRLVINCGQDGGQTVEHLHLHILGGRAMSWPPG